jgi:uncharacterized protein
MTDQNPTPPYGTPQPSQYPTISPEEERTWGTISHAVAGGATLLSAGTLGFLVALVIYLVFKDKGPFVRQHAANALNVQITMGIVMLISIPLMFVLIGFVTYGIALVIGVVLHVMGAVKAGQGEWFDPPMTMRLVR